MRIFLDENLSAHLSTRLNESGHDSVCAYDAGLCGKSDEAIREFAIRQDRILITLDSDFADLSRYPVADTPGIIWLKPVPPITLASIEQHLMIAMDALRDRDLRGLLVVVDSGRIRTRSGI